MVCLQYMAQKAALTWRVQLIALIGTKSWRARRSRSQSACAAIKRSSRLDVSLPGVPPRVQPMLAPTQGIERLRGGRVMRMCCAHRVTPPQARTSIECSWATRPREIRAVMARSKRWMSMEDHGPTLCSPRIGGPSGIRSPHAVDPTRGEQPANRTQCFLVDNNIVLPGGTSLLVARPGRS